MNLTISNGSKKRCRAKFNCIGIGKQINTAVYLLTKLDTRLVMAEHLYDHDNNKTLFDVLKFLINENCKDANVIRELKQLNFK